MTCSRLAVACFCNGPTYATSRALSSRPGQYAFKFTNLHSYRKAVIAQAKVNKPKKGGKQQKTSALDKLLKAKDETEDPTAAADKDEAPGIDGHKSPDVMMLLLVLASSYWQSTKRYLMEDVDFEQLAEELFRASFGLVVTGASDTDEPIIAYANQAALRIWELGWAEFVGSDSGKYMVDAQDPLLSPDAPVTSSKYSGWLLNGAGKKLKICDGLIFEVQSPGGELLGKAIKFTEVELEDGTIVKLDAPPSPPSSSGTEGEEAAPTSVTQEDVDAALAAVQQQADVVRSLKEVKGLTNQDEEVQDAVAELLHRKEVVAGLQKRL